MARANRSAPINTKFRMSAGLPVGALINAADNCGATTLYIMSVTGYRGRLNRFPTASPGSLVLATVKKGRPNLRKKVSQAVIVRQRKMWRRRSGQHISFQDNAGCIVVPPHGALLRATGRIGGPIAVEVQEMWSKLAGVASSSA